MRPIPMSGKPASTNHVTGSAYSMRRRPTFRRAWRQALVISSNQRGKCPTFAQSKLLTSDWLIVEATLPLLCTDFAIAVPTYLCPKSKQVDLDGDYYCSSRRSEGAGRPLRLPVKHSHGILHGLIIDSTCVSLNALLQDRVNMS